MRLDFVLNAEARSHTEVSSVPPVEPLCRKA